MAFAHEPDWLNCQAGTQWNIQEIGTLYNFSMNRIFSLILLLVAGSLDAADTVYPVIPGLHREGLDQRTRGLVLIGEFGCVACHRAGNFKADLNSRKAPNLSAVAARINPRYLEAFLAAPHKVKPGTRMPDIFRGLAQAWFPKPVLGEIAEALAHYLVSLQPVSFTMQAPDHVAAAAMSLRSRPRVLSPSTSGRSVLRTAASSCAA